MIEVNDLRVLAWPAQRKRHENPYTFLLQQSTKPFGIETHEFTLGKLLRQRWDVIHIHWPDMLLLRGGRSAQIAACSALIVLLRVQQLLGARLAWTCHNLNPHEVAYPTITRLFMRTFAKLQDGFMSPSEAGRRAAIDAYPTLADLPSAVSAIGHYRSEYPAPFDAATTRKTLGMAESGSLIVSIGQIRSYKGLSDLARLIPTDGRWTYAIAGAGKDADEVAELERLASGNSNIVLRAEHIADQDVADLLEAADLFATPFRDVLHSSSILLALSFGCRVVAPRLPTLEELSNSVGEGWIELYEGPITVGVVSSVLSKPRPDEPPELGAYEWDTIGKTTAEFFRELVRSS